VQTIVDLPDGAGLRLTTLRYYTPKGHAIQAQGVRPDVVVPTSSEFGVVREKNLEHHLPAEEGAPTETPRPGLELEAKPKPGDRPAEEILADRAVPNDPRTGRDAALAIAYQMLTGALAAPGPTPAREAPQAEPKR
jgi:carboxyl-terminal processing protease